MTQAIHAMKRMHDMHDMQVSQGMPGRRGARARNTRNAAFVLAPLVLAPFARAPLASGALPEYLIRDLLTLVGDDSRTEPGSVPSGIAPDGTVVGLSITVGLDQAYHAFRWNPANAELTDLGVIDPDALSSAAAINAAGDVVGSSFSLGALTPHAVRWPASGPSVVLGAFTPHDISDGGVVVGAMPVTGSIGVTHAVRWSAGAITDLGTLGGESSAAMAIAESGWIVGESLLADNQTSRAFLWHSGVMTNLGTLGGQKSQATAIAPGGWIVGVAELANGRPHAVRWQVDGQAQVVATVDLGTLDNGKTSAAFGVNSAGTVVGVSKDRAFRWSNGSMVDLNSRIDSSSQWDLKRAVAIDDAGRIIGYGFHTGLGRAFVLTPRNVADLNLDGHVDGADLAIVLGAWGGAGGDADINGDGIVGGPDLGIVLGNWGM